jgi:hypothetical protein
MPFEDFGDCLAWWPNRKENNRAWRVRVEEVLKYDEHGNLLSANLDLKNPNAPDGLDHLPPEQLVADILAKERRFAEIIAEIKGALADTQSTTVWPMVPLAEVLSAREETPDPAAIASGEIPIVAKIGFNDGLIHLRDDGETRTKMILVRPGDLLVSGINAAKGAIAIYGQHKAKPAAATIHFGAYVPHKTRVDVRYLWRLLRSDSFRRILLNHLPGGIKTELKAKRLLAIPVPLPPLSEQHRLVALQAKVEALKRLQADTAAELDALLPSLLDKAFTGEL